MSTVNERDVLRRALRLAADGIEPRADGLQRIQARLAPPRPLAVAWAEATWTFLRMRVPDELQRLLEWLGSVVSLAWERLGPSRGTSGRRAPGANGWLRPVAVLGVTIFLVAVGTYVAIDGQQVFAPSSSNALHNGGNGSGPGGSSVGNAGTNALGQSTLGTSGSTRKGKTACRSSRSSTAPPASPTPGGTILSPSPSPSPSDTIQPSPSPSATDSTSPSPGTSGQTQAAGPPIGTTVAGLGSQAVLTRSTAATSSSCTKKKPAQRTTPAPAPAVVSYGRLDDGS